MHRLMYTAQTRGDFATVFVMVAFTLSLGMWSASCQAHEKGHPPLATGSSGDEYEAKLAAAIQKARTGHPLEYDESLGMFAHSDHVGFRYPFSGEALAQAVPSPAVAANLIAPPAEEPAGFLGPKAIIHEDSASGDADAVLAAADDNTMWVAYTSFREGDEDVYVRRRNSDGAWSDEVLLGKSPGADFSPVIEVDSDGHVWCVWCRQSADGSWPLMVCRHDGRRWSEERVLFDGRCYHPQIQRVQGSGNLVLAWEDWSGGNSRVHTSWLEGGKWSEPISVADGSVTQQRPVLASGGDGGVWLAYDVVVDQKYELRLARWDGRVWDHQPHPPEIDGHRRRASIAVDKSGRVWVLPETEVIEPIQVRRAFNGQDVIYNVRPPCRAMLIWTGKRWNALPPGPAMTAKAAVVHIDEKGSVWILARTPGPGTRDFLLVGQRYRGSQWYTGTLSDGPWDGRPDGRLRFRVGKEPVGSVKQPVAVVEREGKVYVAWHETQRLFTFEPAWTYADGPVHTILHTLAIEADQYLEAKPVAYDPSYHGTDSPEVTPLPHAKMARPDASDRFEIDGQPLHVYYGDLHHHTEYSRDPGVVNDDVDGNYRYVRDIRRLDFEGLADHAEHINPHDWYRIRRAASFYNQGEHFAAMVAFEWTSEFYRAGNYQEGHHNVVYRTDGPETRVYSASLPRSNTPLRLIQRIEEEIEAARQKNIDANTLLFPHDPSRWVQPISWSWYNPRIRLLELVQSRGNHEHLGSPQFTPLRNDFQQQLMGKSAQDGLNKGLRWGFIGSGDHQGRPVAGVFALASDRETIFDSLYAKRTFATTGARMVVVASVNGHRMGSEWHGSETEHTIDIYARGSKPITFVELWKNGRMLWRWSPSVESREFKVSHRDPSAPYARENWWYVRVTQEGGEMAWCSPIWFVYEGIEAEVISDAGGPEPHYMTPDYPVPIPILMRNQKDTTVTGTLTLTDIPAGWTLDPNASISFELPPDSWTTYVWYVTAHAEAIDELKALPLKLRVEFADGEKRTHRVTCVQTPELLQTRGQLSELNDAVYLQQDLDLLNQWLRTMAKRWGIDGK